MRHLSTITLALALAFSKAQMVEEKNLYVYFGSCQRYEFGSKAGCEALGKSNVECCNFKVVGLGTMQSKFCITDQQRQGAYSG